MVKVDLKDAYHIVPIHPHDHNLLAVSWRGQAYIDRFLPFVLRSASNIFTAIADVLAWALYHGGIQHQLHYLDDFRFLSRPGSDEAAHYLSQVLELMNELGVPIAMHKIKGPSTTLTFLGILIDSQLLQLRSPADKLQQIRSLLQSCCHKQSCRRKELESLLGHVSHVAVVVQPGRALLRELFTCLKLAHAPHHFVHLNKAARADLCWWNCFLQEWNGWAFLPQQVPADHVY